MSLYLYAIAPADAISIDGHKGLRDHPIRLITRDGIAAVVSDTPDGKLRPRRRNLKAHHGLLSTLMDDATILPMAFGVLAESADDVTSFLVDHAKMLHEQLDRVEGHAEVSLRVRLKVEDIFAYFVERYDELREMRDAYFGDGDATRQQMLKLGERFQEFLEAERSAHRGTVEDGLADVCRAIEADTPKSETEMVNLACLVPRDDVDAFENAVQDVAGDFGDEFLFRYTDPMAPYSFTDISFQ